MPPSLDKNAVQWDAEPAIDPSAVKWDDAPTASLADKMVGGWGGRTLMGMASPVLAGVQMLGGESGRKAVAELDAMKRRGMAAEGKDGVDWYGLMGSMIPGAGIAKGVTAALPAATSALGRIGTGAAIGGATSVAQPVSESSDFWADKAKQVGAGAAIGGVIPAIGETVKKVIGSSTANPTTAATLAEGQAAGYVIPPSRVNPSPMNNTLETISGKASLNQLASKKNSDVTNALAAKSLGLPKDTTLTNDVLDASSAKAGQVYEDAKKLSPTAQWAVESWKQAKADARAHFNHYNANKDPETLKTAKSFRDMAKLMSDEIEHEAIKAGKPELAGALKDASVHIAKVEQVRRALNEADSNVSSRVLGKMFAKPKQSGMTGELATIGKMNNAFPSVMAEAAKIPSPAVSGTDAASSAILGALGFGAAGPAGSALAALPLLRTPARHMALSGPFQRMATEGVSPRYQAMIDALMQQGSAAGGTMAGRAQGGR